MRNMMIAMFVFVLLTGLPVPGAALDLGNKLTADDVVRGGAVVVGGIGDWRRENTRRRQIEATVEMNRRNAEAAENINSRNMDSWDRQTAANERVAMARITADLEREKLRASAEVLRIQANLERERVRTSAEVFRTAAHTGKSGNVSVEDGTVNASVHPKIGTDPRYGPSGPLMR